MESCPLIPRRAEANFEESGVSTVAFNGFMVDSTTVSLYQSPFSRTYILINLKLQEARSFRASNET